MKVRYGFFKKNGPQYLGISFAGDGNALTQFTKERDGRFSAGNQRSLLFWA